jgi:dethiobiotin synthetase
MNVIIAGIHTGIGKTLCSAVICQKLGYDYWKPVQAGTDATDSDFIKAHVSNSKCFIHPETYVLKTPASPHYAAELEGIEIQRHKIRMLKSSNSIVVETAGGLMSPLASRYLNIDLTEQLDTPVILVSNNYLGSINHTLMSVEALQKRNIPILGIVFSGEEVSSTRAYILKYTGLPLLFSIPQMEISREAISTLAATLTIALP